jgi:hypothetical protein
LLGREKIFKIKNGYKKAERPYFRQTKKLSSKSTCGMRGKTMKKKAPAERQTLSVKTGAPGESRTPNLLIRSQTLYPIELQAQVFNKMM